MPIYYFTFVIGKCIIASICHSLRDTGVRKDCNSWTSLNSLWQCRYFVNHESLWWWMMKLPILACA